MLEKKKEEKSYFIYDYENIKYHLSVLMDWFNLYLTTLILMIVIDIEVW